MENQIIISIMKWVFYNPLLNGINIIWDFINSPEVGHLLLFFNGLFKLIEGVAHLLLGGHSLHDPLVVVDELVEELPLRVVLEHHITLVDVTTIQIQHIPFDVWLVRAIFNDAD